MRFIRLKLRFENSKNKSGCKAYFKNIENLRKVASKEYMYDGIK